MAYVSRILMAVMFACSLSACGTKQTLDQAIHCDDFQRLSDGNWSTTKDVSLDYLVNGIEYQLNYSKDLHITPKVGNEAPRLTAALDKKCGSKP